jgi:hypothetical protein
VWKEADKKRAHVMRAKANPIKIEEERYDQP